MSKTILITGASSGIGKSTARYFHEKGWNVIATMRTPEQEQELTTLSNALVTRLDVQDSASIRSAVEQGLARFGRIDVLVNNAGFGAYGPLEATPMEKVRRQFEVNVMGMFETTKALLPQLRAQKEGVIINISSIGGKIAFPLGTLYHASKFAVEGFSEALSFEMDAIGVKVKIVEPGMIRTDFGGRSLDFNNDQGLPEYQAVVEKLMTGVGALVERGSAPEVVAEVIYAAATDGTNQLRYTAGADAAQLMAARKASDDTAFLQQMRDQFGL